MLVHTFNTFTTSGGNCINAELDTRRYIRSTKMPARIACATDRNFGFSSDFLRVVASCRVNVEANHSRTSGGTASGCTSDSSSSSSARRLVLFGGWEFQMDKVERKECAKRLAIFFKELISGLHILHTSYFSI